MSQQNLIAVEQVGCCVFGVGKTVIGAVRDANKWLDWENRVSAGTVGFNTRPNDGEMRLVRITPALASAVKAFGGDVAYGSLDHNTICTLEEQDAAI